MAEITITISDAKVADFVSGFLVRYPKPKELEVKEHIRQCIKQWLFENYRSGKEELAAMAAVLDTDIIS